jgi:Zn finger protein HypA/HybF involved in hydrogenase expression
MSTASIIVDLRHVRCGNCKVALQDELAAACPTCGAEFDVISSNHVGLAGKLRKKRQDASVLERDFK